MPIGEILVDIVGQAVMEAGGHAIHRKFGWIGCVAAVTLIIGAIALLIWLAK